MSDLQCPARLLLAATAPTPGALALERVLAVYTDAGLTGPAGAIATALGVDLRPLEGPVTVDSLTGIADLHRGETVLVLLSEGDLVGCAERLGAADPTGLLRVHVDGDGAGLGGG